MTQETLRDPQVRVDVARTINEVEAMRPSWEAAEISDIDSDIDYFLTVVRAGASVIRPHVVHIRRPGRPDMFGIARLETYPLRLALGYRTLGRPTLTAIVVTFGGIVGAEHPDDVELVLGELGRPLRDHTAEALVIRRLDRAGVQYEVARRAAGPWRIRGQGSCRRWTAEAPSDLETFLATRSAKTRQTIRRQDRRLRRDHDVELRRFSSPADTDDLVRDMETVAARTYQRGIGVGYHASPLTRALTELGLQRGWLRTWMLYADHLPVAFWTGTTYSGTFTVGTPGYDPAYTKDSVGRYTMHRMIEDVCADERVVRLDLGQGDAEYKDAFDASSTKEADVTLLARRVRPVLLGATASVLALLNTSVKQLAERSDLGTKLVRSWQRRLAPGPEHGGGSQDGTRHGE